MLHHMSLRFIHYIIFAPYALHGKAGAARHLVHLIAVQPGGIYNIACLKIPLGGMQAVALPGAVYAGNGGGKPQLAAVHHGGLGQRQRVFPRAYDGGGGGVQRGGHFVAHIWLQCVHFISGQQLNAGHTIGKALLVQLLQVALVLLTKGQHQRADLLPLHIQLFTQLLGQRHAAHIGLSHQGAGGRVISRVQNSAVGFGGHIGHIVFGLQHQHAAVVPAQFVGSSGAHYPAADDSNIIHHWFLLFNERNRLLKPPQIYHYKGGFSIAKKEKKTVKK